MQCEETSLQITIIKEKLKNAVEKILEIIGNYYNEKIISANALLPYGTIWEAISNCTHLQTALAPNQPGMCKRVQFP